VSADDDFEFDFGLELRCVGCGSERDVDLDAGGKTIASGESTMVVEVPEPCHCGERRVKLSFDVETT